MCCPSPTPPSGTAETMAWAVRVVGKPTAAACGGYGATCQYLPAEMTPIRDQSPEYAASVSASMTWAGHSTHHTASIVHETSCSQYCPAVSEALKATAAE